MTSRRSFLQLTGAALAIGAVPLRAAEPNAKAKLDQALGSSALIYITPLKKTGSESKCHAEVWFVYDGANIYVVTSSSAWRAKAIGSGLTGAQMWVGEFGVWKDANDAYRSAPKLIANGAKVDDAATQARILDAFGTKYRPEWPKWGLRFRDGLKDGSRVMLRYTPTTA